MYMDIVNREVYSIMKDSCTRKLMHAYQHQFAPNIVRWVPVASD